MKKTKQATQTAPKSSSTPVAMVRIRKEQVVVAGNPYIPNSRWQDQGNADGGEGRLLAFDKVTYLQPVMTSPLRGRDNRRRNTTTTTISAASASATTSSNTNQDDHHADDMNHLLQGLQACTIGKRREGTAVPDKAASIYVKSTNKATKKKKVDNDDDDDAEEWIETTTTEEEEDDDDDTSSDGASDIYDSQADDDLAWDFLDSDDDDDDNDNHNVLDPFSPEKARGRFSYTIHSPRSAETKEVKRSARHSIGTPSSLPRSATNKNRLVFTSPPPRTAASQTKSQK